MTMTLSINPPEGFEIDKEKSYPNSNEIVYKPIKNRLPKKWEDFKEIRGYYIYFDTTIKEIEQEIVIPENCNIWTTKELAEASLALCQLVRFRDAWNEGWKPDWMSDGYKCVIKVFLNKIERDYSVSTNFVLSFKTEEIRDEFAKTFKELIETAKPLL